MDEEYFIIFTASIALFYILADRMAYEKFDVDTRNNFSDLVMFNIVSDFAANTSVNEEVLPKVINSQVKLYAPYSKRLAPDNKEDGMKGVLFWEFGKNIGNDFELGPDAVHQITLSSLRIGCEQMVQTAKLFESI